MLLLGVLAATPDFDVLAKAVKKRHDYWFPSHWRRFPHGSCCPVSGVAVQVAIVSVSGALLTVV